MAGRSALLALLAAGASDAAFYLPGVAPKSYKTRDNVRHGEESLESVQGGSGGRALIAKPTRV